MKRALHSLLCKVVLAVLTLMIGTFTSFGQYEEQTSFFEAGLSIGPSNFLGDLGGNFGKGTTFLKDNNFPLTKLMYGLYVGYYPKEWLGIRLSGNLGSLEGDDAIIKSKGGLEDARKRRNSNFRSKLSEVTLMLELYPTVFLEYEPSDIFHKIRPYGVIGVGLFHFNPQGTDPLTGNWVDLAPLHTEGQGFPEYPDRKEYKLTQMNIPMGFGAKYFLSQTVNLSLEIVHRKTFTDYIDDVSTTYIDPALFYAHLPLQQAQLAERMANKSNQLVGNTPYTPGMKRGTSTNNDAYYSVVFKLGIRLGTGSGRRWRNSTSCPVHF